MTVRRLALAGLAGLVLVGIILALTALVGRSLYSRATFGIWDPTALPTRISYCDRGYLPGSHVSRAQIDDTGNAFGVVPFRQVSSTADGRPIFAKPMPDSVRREHGTLVCTMVVYLKVGADDYIAYGLNGGP